MCKCTFCNIAANKMKTNLIYEDKIVMAFLDIDPISEGHILLIPKEHYFDVDEMPEQVLFHLMKLSKKIVAAIKETYKPDGYTIMQNGGEFNDAGHYHLHIFPRYKNDGFGWISPKGSFRCNKNIAKAITDKLK